MDRPLYPQPPGGEERPRFGGRPSIPSFKASMPKGQVVAIGLFALLIALSLSKRNPIDRQSLILFGVVVMSITIHEVAHAATALAFGDDTAKRAGRITLNPIRHGAFGILILPAVMILAGAPPIAYAATPVRPSNLRSPRNHGLLVSLAGPAANILLAVGAALLLRTLYPTWIRQVGTYPASFEPLAVAVLVAVGALNTILAVFNLLPVPPLDGAAVIERLLPRSLQAPYLQFRRFAPMILLFAIFAFPNRGFLNALFDPALRAWASLLR